MWGRVGWWARTAKFCPVTPGCAAEGRAVFRDGCAALEARDGVALDRAKLALERWLAEGPWTGGRATSAAGAASPLAGVVEAWRRDLARAWSLQDSARAAGLSYTRFRARFVLEYGQAPYTHLLRLELARRWLRSTNEPVKAVALRCGFTRAEPFIRAFAKAHGATPARWRAAQTDAARDDKKLAPHGGRGVRERV